MRVENAIALAADRLVHVARRKSRSALASGTVNGERLSHATARARHAGSAAWRFFTWSSNSGIVSTMTNTVTITSAPNTNVIARPRRIRCASNHSMIGLRVPPMNRAATSTSTTRTSCPRSQAPATASITFAIVAKETSNRMTRGSLGAGAVGGNRGGSITVLANSMRFVG